MCESNDRKVMCDFNVMKPWEKNGLLEDYERVNDEEM